MNKRKCGILMPVSSLPSPYGIGTLGKAAFEFVDFLAKSGQSYWQLLPLGPTSYGDSPYQSFSSYAGNPYFIDLDLLVKQKLVKKKTIEELEWGSDPEKVDYGLMYQNRYKVLREAFDTANKPANAEHYGTELEAFCNENRRWLDEYTLFMAVKKYFGDVAWTEWPDEDIRLHRPEAIEKYRLLLADNIKFYSFIQYLFFSQWRELKQYAGEKGIKIIGDVPIYVAMDSVDVWSESGWFMLDEKNIPVEVAGVPPDYFSADGQLWGNPLYDWDKMRADGYGWWIRRIDGATRLYDVIRIDHFRGFESFWAVPYGDDTARSGRWVKGPGLEVVNAITGWFSGTEFIAEDLGFLTQEVLDMVSQSGLPGMKILEFAFDAREPGDYLPYNYPVNSICYGGTHDNAPLLAWKDEADAGDIKLACRYVGINKEEGFVWGMIRAGMESASILFVDQMQDYLELGAASRMNTPGTPSGNWRWRMKKGAADAKLAKKLRELTDLYGRL